LLSAERLGGLTASLSARALPPVTRGWEDVAREGVRGWIAEHRTAAWSVANLMAVGWMVGGVIVMADVVITGGVVGTLGGIAASGAAGPAGAALLQVLGKLHLQTVAETACQSWFDERQEVLRVHLVDDFARGVFEPWFADRDALERVPVGDLRRAVAELAACAGGSAEVGR
jgi:hypothetical protein